VDVITMASFDWYQRWQGSRWRKRGADYEALKAGVTARLLEQVYARLPRLRGKVDVVEASTPLSAAHFSGHPRGELYGLDHTPARYRVPLHPRTPIDGLYLTGADLATCGVAGAVLGGLITASAIVGPQVIPRVLRPSSRRPNLV
jgi:all-trans-retinol 13,14-reductase